MFLLSSFSLMAGELKLKCEYKKELNNPPIPIVSSINLTIKSYRVSENYENEIFFTLQGRSMEGRCKTVAKDDFEVALECAMEDSSDLKVNYIATQNQVAVDMIVATVFYGCE